MPGRLKALEGVLLGTALGDALGLPAEGMSAAAVMRRWGRLEDFRLLGRTGFVSDDTELAALTAQALALSPDDAGGCVAAFRRSLAGWALRLPFGIGLATLRASAKALLGFSRTGVESAGNGACTRAPVIGVYFAGDAERRRAFGEALARVTHTDPRAVQAALFAAEVAAHAAAGKAPADAVCEALSVVSNDELRAAIEDARDLADAEAEADEAAEETGVTGYSVHTCAIAAFSYIRWGREPLRAIRETITAGGDTDSAAALVGAWAGAGAGADGLPAELLGRLCGGPFGPAHLRALAGALEAGAPPPGYLWPAALLRNLALYPVILAHGLRRLFP
ncbi:MAG: ADP-ribosylglycohydrolase family protein [Elusimicrobia bacterium]|nr:ADP-ribosylglycohydrolase family protein [Elusimicrobiota bacterium]